jgi:hypothetical protein
MQEVLLRTMVVDTAHRRQIQAGSRVIATKTVPRKVEIRLVWPGKTRGRASSKDGPVVTWRSLAAARSTGGCITQSDALREQVCGCLAQDIEFSLGLHIGNHRGLIQEGLL